MYLICKHKTPNAQLLEYTIEGTADLVISFQTPKKKKVEVYWTLLK